MCCIVPNIALHLCYQSIANKKLIVMKATANKFALIEPSTMEALTMEVKETLAPASVLSQHKVFSAADLWNIQRQVKQRVQRRFI